ncbi:MAG: hypothetical protein P4L41_12290 [Flavipsychrobacter sp.]|nr:hypothetical protein [Flavipsychrobacter sp.]
MYRFHAKYIFPFFLLFLFAFGVTSIAQTSTVSNPTSTRENNPYSRFGVGEALNGNNAVLQGMGNISSAYENPYTINSDNPASYSFLKLTTYEAGMQGSVRNVAANGLNYTTGNATLNYLNIGVPVGKHGGLVFGFTPQTRVYYNLADTAVYPGAGQIRRSFGGDGGLNYAYIGAAYEYKGFSAGFNFGYMFGSINSYSFADNIDTTATMSSEFSNYEKIGGIYWKGGLMYETKLNKDLVLRVGGTLALAQSLNQIQNNYWISSYQFYDTLVQDTSYQSNQSKGKIRLPMTYSFGVHLAKAEHWDVGADYTATQWSQFTNNGIGQPSDSLASTAYKISIGGEYVPNASNIRNFWSRVTYRFGMYYGTDPVYLRNTQLNYYGLTAGMSLPFRRSTSEFHGAIDVGRMGTQSNGLIEQTYVKLTLGLTFNAKWFIPRKYE